MWRRKSKYRQRQRRAAGMQQVCQTKVRERRRDGASGVRMVARPVGLSLLVSED